MVGLQFASEVFRKEVCDSTVSCTFHILNVVSGYTGTLLGITCDKSIYLWNCDNYEPYNNPERAVFPSSPGRVVDILGASGASDPGSNPGRGVGMEDYLTSFS